MKQPGRDKDKDEEDDFNTIKIVEIKGGRICLYKGEIYTPEYMAKYFDMK